MCFAEKYIHQKIHIFIVKVEVDKLDWIIERFRQNKISLLTAAEEKGMPVSVFIDELIRRNVRWGIGLEEYRAGKAVLEEFIDNKIEK